MPLRANAVLIFESYTVLDTAVQFRFLCQDPGPGMESHYSVICTDAEISALSDLASFNTLILAKLRRLYRGQGIASRLDALIGRSVTLP